MLYRSILLPVDVAHADAAPAAHGQLKLDAASMRQAVVMMEVLGKPVALRDPAQAQR